MLIISDNTSSSNNIKDKGLDDHPLIGNYQIYYQDHFSTINPSFSEYYAIKGILRPPNSHSDAGRKVSFVEIPSISGQAQETAAANVGADENTAANANTVADENAAANANTAAASSKQETITMQELQYLL